MSRRHVEEKVVTALFNAYMQYPAYLPREWQNQAEKLTRKAYARLVTDFLSGMTDPYALCEYEGLFDHRVNLP